ncbi:MAG: TraR/DksA family transcriptional regulator [Gemmataceae bacterium]
MARRDALLRLHKSLTARRDELRMRLGGELSELRKYGDASGDSADQAFDSAGEEVSSQLAQLEAKELLQIERSLQRLKGGTYGVCEGCGKKIPVARLNALPFSSTCIACQRELELYGEIGGRGGAGSWDKVSDMPSSLEEDREVNISDLEMDFSK